MDSKLQIISGTYRGRKLHLPPMARPTQNMARGAIFNMLAGILSPNDKIVVWDAFAGSGALGIEILSRYPNATGVFTDAVPESVRVIRKNLDGFSQKHTIEQIDAMCAIKKHAAGADIIFVDPPYDMAETGIKFVEKLAKSVRPGTLVVQEIEAKVSYVPDETLWNILRDKQYGRARFVFLQRKVDK